jgi:hypothetical protein
MSGLLLEIVRQFPPFGYPPVITIYACLQGDFGGAGAGSLKGIWPSTDAVGVIPSESRFKPLPQ